ERGRAPPRPPPGLAAKEARTCAPVPRRVPAPLEPRARCAVPRDADAPPLWAHRHTRRAAREGGLPETASRAPRRPRRASGDSSEKASEKAAAPPAFEEAQGGAKVGEVWIPVNAPAPPAK